MADLAVDSRACPYSEQSTVGAERILAARLFVHLILTGMGGSIWTFSMRRQRAMRERVSACQSQAIIGLLQTHPNQALTEMAGMCGYDFLVLDGEHGVFSETDYLQAFQALAAMDALAMVRLAGHDARAAGRYLDMGADAILVPNVATADQARELARAMEYPPAGTRGVGAPVHRLTRYGMDFSTHLQAPRADACLLVMIESSLGVTNVEHILAVDGVDGVFIGPYDLSASLGCLGDFSRPVYAQALARIEQAAAATGKYLGTAVHPGNPLEALVARGYSILITAADIPLIREAMSAQVAQVRASMQSHSFLQNKTGPEDEFLRT